MYGEEILMKGETEEITRIIRDAATKARQETSSEPEPALTEPVKWPVACTVGPGLEGAIACESRVGYVNGTKGWLVYRGYDIFDLCAHSSFEEVSYLLLHGQLPTSHELKVYREMLCQRRSLPGTIRMLQALPVEKLKPMAALRLGVNLMRQQQTYLDLDSAESSGGSTINTDDDLAVATIGAERALYEFEKKVHCRPTCVDKNLRGAEGLQSCYHLIAGLPTLLAAIARLRAGKLPLEPDPELSHAANLLYMMNGCKPSPEEERIMDVALILHADHGLNASTFAAQVVASTLSDIYFAVGAGIAALNGPLHGGANEQVLYTLAEVGSKDKVKEWYAKARSEKRKIMGFGHRVYKAYDPRARILGPLAEYMVGCRPEQEVLFATARALEQEVVSTLGKEKKIFPNVDFYSGMVYDAMDIPVEMYTPIFAVSRVAGWPARVLEYLASNRIFRPRGIYIGELEKQYVSEDKR